MYFNQSEDSQQKDAMNKNKRIVHEFFRGFILSSSQMSLIEMFDQVQKAGGKEFEKQLVKLHETLLEVKKCIWDEAKQLPYVQNAFWYGFRSQYRTLTDLQKAAKVFPLQLQITVPGLGKKKLEIVQCGPGLLKELSEVKQAKDLAKKCDRVFCDFFDHAFRQAKLAYLKINDPEEYEKELKGPQFEYSCFGGIEAIIQKANVENEIPSGESDNVQPASNMRTDRMSDKLASGRKQEKHRNDSSDSEVDIEQVPEQSQQKSKGKTLGKSAGKRSIKLGKKRVTHEDLPKDHKAVEKGGLHGDGQEVHSQDSGADESGEEQTKQKRQKT